MSDILDDTDDDTPDGSCWVCGGSGGGYPPFACAVCRGTGRSRIHDQELADRRAEEMRDRKIDDELMGDAIGLAKSLFGPDSGIPSKERQEIDEKCGTLSNPCDFEY